MRCELCTKKLGRAEIAHSIRYGTVDSDIFLPDRESAPTVVCQNCGELLLKQINKGDRPRSIPMTRRTRIILEERHHITRSKPFTISVDEAERAWQWVRAKMGLEREAEFCIHMLRHSCASRLVNAGVDLYVVKEWLGHSSIQITERYAHLNPMKLVHAVEMLE